MAERTVKCDFCGRRTARLRRVTRSYGRGRGQFLIRNIPSFSCSSCGETYFTAQTIHEVERIKTHHRFLAITRRVAVADFPSGYRRRAG